MTSQVPRVEEEEATASTSSSFTISVTQRQMPTGGIPCSPQSPQRGSSPTTAVASIPMGPSDKASDNQIRELEDFLPGLQQALRTKVHDLVQFLLLKYRMKELTSKAEMQARVIRDYVQYYPVIFREASEGLKLIFGIDMVEVDPLVHSYVLVTALGITYDEMLHGIEGIPKTGLLIIMLGITCLNDDYVSEEVVWEVLSMMGIHPTEHHYIAGNPRTLITEIFVQEGYIEYREMFDTNPVQYGFLWGPRAFAETSKMNILEFLAKISGLL